MGKKKRFKRGLALLLTAALAIGSVNVTASPTQAAETEPAIESTGAVAENLQGYSGTPVEPKKISEENYAEYGFTSDNYASYIGYYAINNADEMYGFAALVNSKTADDAIGDFKAIQENAVLTSDINLVTNKGASIDWTPIGDDHDYYAGTFDGQGHRIYNLKVKDTVGGGHALFGFVTGGAVISNVILDASCSIKGSRNVAGIVGNISSVLGSNVVIKNCGNEATISGEICVAGIIGEYATDNVKVIVENCYNTGAIRGSYNTAAIIGDIGGYAQVINCYNAGTVSGIIPGQSFVGNNGEAYVGTLTNCYQLDSIEEQENVTSVSIEQMKSGEVCYLLNGGAEEQINWYQTLTGESADEYPVLFDAESVYRYIDENESASYKNEKCDHENKQMIHVDATCVTDGYTSYHCTNCRRQWITETAVALEHDFDSTTGKCSRCNLVLQEMTDPITPKQITESNYTDYDFAKENLEKYRDYYVITSAEEMFGFAELVNDGATTANAVLASDINFAEKLVTLDETAALNIFEWTPIGKDNAVYKGTFDGQGHRLYNLTIDLAEDKVGLFGYIDGGTQICNVILDATCYIKGANYVGGIVGAGKQSSTEILIENCGNEGTVIGEKNAAAMVGCLAPGEQVNNAYLTIQNCYNMGNIKGTSESATFSGWIGLNTKLINCYNAGTISGAVIGKSFARHSDEGASIYTNCYQIDTVGTQDNITSVTENKVKSGALCCLLNENQTDIRWYQTLTGESANAYPVLFGAEKVYKHQVLGSNVRYYYLNSSEECQHKNRQLKESKVATCLENGYTKYSCDDCGGVWKEEEVAAFGHYYAEDTHKCIRCDKVQVYDGTEETPAKITEQNYATYGLSAEEYKEYLGFYAVTTPNELYGYAALVNGTEPDASAILVNDIVINEKLTNADGTVNEDSDWIEWNSLGKTVNTAFEGTLDGRGHVISGLYCSRKNLSSFIDYAKNCTVRNLGIEDSYFAASDVSGFLYYIAGEILIENCYTTAILNAGYRCAGIVGDAQGYVSGNVMIRQTAFLGEMSGFTSNKTQILNDAYANNAAVNVEQCVYLRGEDDDAIYLFGQGYTAEECANGAATYALNGGETEQPVWYQTIGTDAFPVWDATHEKVYAATPCHGTYANEPNVEIQHDFANGVTCVNCGADMEPACEDGIYQISNYRELLWFAEKANDLADKNDIVAAKNLSAVLTADIVANVGVLDENDALANAETEKNVWSMIDRFYGTLDGQGHTISGLYYKGTGYFAFCNVLHGTLQNIGVVDSYFETGQFESVATFAIYMGSESAAIRNCYSTATLLGRNAGIVYYYYAGTIENCYAANSYRDSGIFIAATKTASNCYQLTINTNAEQVAETNESVGRTNGYKFTKEEFASGKIAYLLNEGAGTEVWHQNLGNDGDALPTLDGSHAKVYVEGTRSCDGSWVNATYTNVEPITESNVPEHQWNANKICTVCHQGQQPQIENGVYQIGTYGELVWFAQQVNDGYLYIDGELTADITANENLLNADGTLAVASPTYEWKQMYEFYGTLDGNGHTISGVYMQMKTWSVALCNRLGGTLQNIGIIDSYFDGDAGAYTFANRDVYDSKAIIRNCYSAATLTSKFWCAGIAEGWGNNEDSKIENCYYAGKMLSNTKYGIIKRSDYNISEASFLDSYNIINCYYIEDCYSENYVQTGTAVTAEAFASGEVAYLLNGAKSAGTTWYQKLSGENDAYPHLKASDDSIVYAEYAHGTNVIKACGNTGVGIHTEPCSSRTHDSNIGENKTCGICGQTVAAIIEAEDAKVNYGYTEAIELKPTITKDDDVEIVEARWYEIVKTSTGERLKALTLAGEIADTLTVETGKEAGEYKYSFIVKTSDSDSQTRRDITVVVDKIFLAADTFTYMAPTDLSYNGAAKRAEVKLKEEIVGAGKITSIKYKKDNQGGVLDEAVNAGTYHVYAIVSEGTNYKASEIEVGRFTISNIEAPASANIRYNGMTQASTYETNSSVVVSAAGYTVSDSMTGTFAESYVITSATNGTVTKTLYFKDSAGHVSTGKNVSVTFKAKEVTQDAATTVQTLPNKGKSVKVGNATYKVTVSHKTKGTVTFVKPTNKNQKSITVPDSVKINGYTFKVTAIAASACKSNSKLTTVTIGKNVKTIGKNAFASCKKLSKITIKTTKLTTKTVGKNAFKGIKAKATIKVPKAKVKAYTKLLRSKGVSKTSKIKK